MPRVVHFEIHAEQPARAIAFYERLLGWKFQRYGETEYWLIETGPKDQPGIDGGLLPRRGEINGDAVIAYVCTVDVENLDEKVRTAEHAGGTIALARQPIPGIGWLAYVKDTEGNIFGMMQGDENAGKES
jgi:uncharacterized protein